MTFTARKETFPIFQNCIYKTERGIKKAKSGKRERERAEEYNNEI